MKTILLHASYFAPNFGDVLLWQVTGRLLRQIEPKARYVTANLPGEMRSFYDPEHNYADCKPDETIDVTVFAGGGYFCPPERKKIKWHLRNYLRHRKALKFARRSRRVGFLGVGFGNLGISPLAHLVRRINSDFAYLRDELSAAAFRKYSRSPNIDVCDDLAFSYLIQNANSYPAQPEIGTLGLHLGAVEPGTESYASFVQVAGVVIKHMAPTKVRVFIDCEQEGSISAANALVAEVGLPGQIEVYRGKLDDFLTKISQVPIIITTKLHVGICATALAVPVVSMPAHHKTARFYRKIGMEHCIVQKGNLSPSQLTSIIERKVPDSVLNNTKEEFAAIMNTLNENFR